MVSRRMLRNSDQMRRAAHRYAGFMLI